MYIEKLEQIGDTYLNISYKEKNSFAIIFNTIVNVLII